MLEQDRVANALLLAEEVDADVRNSALRDSLPIARLGLDLFEPTLLSERVMNDGFC
jgi:hypothetical protein